MPTTSRGTAYTVHEWTNAEGDQSIWAVADRVEHSPHPRPALLYCHGNGGSYDVFTTSAGYKPLRDLLIDNGWVYIETLGGSPSHWGREFAMESYAAAALEAADRQPISTIVVHGRSMGGTVASSLAIKPEWGLKQHVSGLLLESAVQDMYLRHVTRGYSLNGQYPEGRPSEGGDPAAFAAAVAPFNPIQFDVALYADMPVQFVHGAADDNVIPSGNAQAQYNRIKNVAPYADLVLRPGGTHAVGESASPAFVNPAWRFLRRAAGVYPERVRLTLDGQPLRRRAGYINPGWRAGTVVPLNS